MKLHDIRLSTRITAITLLIVAVGAVAFLFLERAHHREAYINERSTDLEKGLHAENMRLIQVVDTLRRDVLFLSNIPPVSGIVRAALNNGYDARYNNTHQVWVERMQQIFSAFSRAHPDYYKIRFIGVANGGREIVHIVNRGEQIEITPSDRLQTKGDADYVKATFGLHEGQVYLSEFNLNQAWGVMELPYRPTLRASTPVFTPSGKVFGMVMINIDVNSLLESATLGLPSGTQTYITNRDGQYLFHHDLQRAFKFELGSKDNIITDFPFVKTMFDPQAADYLPLHDVIAKTGKYAAASRIHFDPGHPERFLLLMYHIPDAVVASHIASLPVADIAAGFIGMLLFGGIALFSLRRTFSPLEQIAAAANKIAAGDQNISLPKSGGGEIGSLSSALDAMLDRLSQRGKLLRESENRYRLLVESSPFCIHEIDLEGRLLSMNRAGLDMLGLDNDEKIRGMSYLDAVSQQDAGRVGALLQDAINNGTPSHFEFTASGDALLYFKSCFIPIRDADGKVLKLMGITEDITERKKFEATRAKVSNTGRFNIAGETTASLTHELSQPLTACNNYLDVCLRRMDEKDWGREKLKETLQLACKQIGRAGEIINRFKGAVKKQELEYTLVDINLLAREVMAFLAGEIKVQSISMHMALFPLPQVMACREEIRQVLLSLCENAIEAMHSSPQRELYVTTRVIESGHVMVGISDSGEGVLPARMKTLFEPFQTSREGGLGLSLSICRSIIEKHGGRIWADPQREFGAEFYFTLPVEVHHE